MPSTLPASLMAVLRCPATGSPLRQEGDELVAVQDETMRYPIEHGVPHLLPADSSV